MHVFVHSFSARASDQTNQIYLGGLIKLVLRPNQIYYALTNFAKAEPGATRRGVPGPRVRALFIIAP